MLTRGVEKAIPLTFLYPEFATLSFESHESYVDHVLARNKHQAQLLQKFKYDRAVQSRAYQPGDVVWVFCRYVHRRAHLN